VVAQALGRKFARIPFGGLSSALDLRGLSKVQPEAEPGLIIKALRRVGSKNPVILLDELDRITPESRGSIMGVLLELLDPEQNSGFTDHYIDFPFDLSQAIFVATANNTNNIATAVMDRMEVIQLPSYNDDEKITIAKKFILPRLEAEVGLNPNTVVIDDAVWKHIARLSGYDPGIRSVERRVEAIIRKIAFRVVHRGEAQFTINEGNMKEYLE
jgi:ATP-dependent Lon protease